MGIDTNYKKFLQRYSNCWTKIDGQIVMGTPARKESYVTPQILPPSGNAIPFPRDACVCIYDSMGKLKEFDGYKIKNGKDFVYNHVLDYPLSFLNVVGTEAFFQCFDRGSPINKDAEHKERYSGLNPIDLNVFGNDDAVLNDRTIVNAEQWKRYTNDPVFKQEILEYVTNKIINECDPDQKPRMNNWKPPPDKIYFLFGGTMEKAPKDRKSRVEKGRFVPSSDIYYVANWNGTSSTPSEDIPVDPTVSDYLQKMEYRRREGIYAAPDGSFPKKELDNLLEGEMCAMYFSKVYSACGKNVMIVSGDGDMLIQSLLACKDRIDPDMGGFKNKVYLRLLGRGYAEDVDINLLYEALCNDPIFVRAGVSDPAPIIAACSCLSQNDYFQGYCFGIGNCPAEDNPFDIPVPYVLWTMLRILGTPAGKNMIISASDHHARDSRYERVPLIVDEDSFISFTKAIYVYKYHKRATTKYVKSGMAGVEKEICPKRSAILGDSKEAAGEMKSVKDAERTVRNYLKDLSQIKNRMMVSRRARVYSRCLEWVLNYFYNGYREDCRITSPVATLRSISYHGWCNELDLEGNVECKMSDRVSLRRHTEKYGWCFSPTYKTPCEAEKGGMQIYVPIIIASQDSVKDDDDNAIKNGEISDMKDEYDDDNDNDGKKENKKKRARTIEKENSSSRPKKKLKRRSAATKKGESVMGKPRKIVKSSHPMVKIERKHVSIRLQQ